MRRRFTVLPLILLLLPTMTSSLVRIATFALTPRISLAIVRGSVLDFEHSNGAIVNAANEECLGGGGVDGAITAAGGKNLRRDRESLPILDDSTGVRCPTGQARITGPNTYGTLRVNHVIHAVGPDYWAYDTPEEGDMLVALAYRSSLDCAQQARLQSVAFSLLSAGLFRGTQSLKQVLQVGVESLCDWAEMKEQQQEETVLQEIILCGFNENEVTTLVEIATEMDLKKRVDECSDESE